MEERAIVEHVRKHGMDNRVSTICTLLAGYKAKLVHAKAFETIVDLYRSDEKLYNGSVEDPTIQLLGSKICSTSLSPPTRET
jgi:hypothetical protein